MARCTGAACLVVTLSAVPCLGQGTSSAFEVASVKENKTGSTLSYVTPAPGRLTITNAPLRDIIARAFELDMMLDRFVLMGGPNRLLSRRFDIVGTTPEDTSRAQQMLMLRTLLAERFDLRTHSERRSRPVYVVTVARPGTLGPQLDQSSHDCAAFLRARKENPQLESPRNVAGKPLCRGSYEFNTPERGAMTRRYAGSIDVLIGRMQAFVDRPLVDATGLTGLFEWTVSFSQVGGPDSTVGSIFSAFPEQLGLKLEARSEPIDVLVIDSVKMPTAN
jgi:uncharacterized protein (TIGR03435 family)